MTAETPSSRLVVLGGVLAVAITVVICWTIISIAPRAAIPSTPAGPVRPAAAVRLGVQAELSAGGVTVGRALPALSFRLEPGQALDARLPAGAFEGAFTVTFSSGRIRYARLGALIENGSLIVRRRDEILVSEHAEEPRMALSREPVFLGSRAQEVTFEFRTGGNGPTALRAMWQPEGSAVPLPLPSDGALLDEDPALAGMVLVQRSGCVRCHRSADAGLQQALEVAEPPLLDDVASRVRPSWVRRWLEDPRALKATARMPAMFHGAADDRERIEDIVHFLAANGSPLGDDAPPSRADVDTGRRLYHEVGCVACHGPLEGQEGGPPPAAPRRYHGLGALAHKTTIAALSRYLEDPLAAHPGGLMPSLLLDADEARRIAAYLIEHDRLAAGPRDVREPAPDPQRVERGRRLFAEVGCAACHEMATLAAAPADPPARPLEQLATSSLGNGCTGATPRPGRPHYEMSDGQQRDLRAFLDRIAERRSDDVPHDALAATLLRLDCVACHPFHAHGGPDPAIQPWFRTQGEADLGDEGRLPPMLSDAGARLQPLWIARALAAGARARPYLATRMPVFSGDDVGHLPAALSAVAGVPLVSDDDPQFDLAAASAGHDLVGDRKMNCIQCHDIAGRRGTGTPGPDLAKMIERLRYEGFARWLHDPSLIRPGTRMPSFFLGGRSAFVEHFDGAAEEQIRAIWCYLAQGEMLPLPRGIVDPAGLALEVTDEPIVFRTFMSAGGVRAIACGFPEQVHCAFDADRCELVAVWTGSFLNASGAWAARGGSQTNPESLRWRAGDEPVLRPVSPGAPLERRFRGYRLDATRRPVFRYDLVAEDVTIEVTERPRPFRDARSATLRRAVELRGPAGAGLVMAPGRLRLTTGRGRFDERPDEGTVLITLDGDGHASFVLEVTW